MARFKCYDCGGDFDELETVNRYNNEEGGADE